MLRSTLRSDLPVASARTAAAILSFVLGRGLAKDLSQKRAGSPAPRFVSGYLAAEELERIPPVVLAVRPSGGLRPLPF